MRTAIALLFLVAVPLAAAADRDDRVALGEAHLERAAMLRSEGAPAYAVRLQLIDAARCARQALQEDPSAQDPNNHVFRQGRYEEAVALTEEVISMDPQRVISIYARDAALRAIAKGRAEKD